MNLKNIPLLIFKILKKKREFFVFLISSILFFLINIFFSNFRDLYSIIEDRGITEMLKIFPLFVWNYNAFINNFISIGLIILSIVFGILMGLIYHKTKILKKFSKKTGPLASTGIFLGIIAPGCSACGVGIISFLGFGSAIIPLLPWEGLEILLISLSILLFSVYKISINIERGIVCENDFLKK